ncbi:MAG TPA: hypothetical protein VF167_15090 [Longimicrobiaceae bacterium]
MFHGREAELQERVDRDRVHLTYASEGERRPVVAELATFRAKLRGPEAAEEPAAIDLAELCEWDPEGQDQADAMLTRGEAG